MPLESSDIKNIAKLARLSIKEDEINHYQHDLVNILELVKQMDKVNTEKVLPLAHPLDITSRLREDKIVETDRRDENQRSAPEVNNGFYLVPKVIE